MENKLPINSNEFENTSSHQCGNYEIIISNKYDFNSLKTEWLEIQGVTNVPFFLSWIWISNWIISYSPELLVVKARLNGETIAIGLFTYSIENRHKIISSRQLRLHQTGQHEFDQIWIEYNDFICKKEHRINAINACFKILHQSIFRWDELILSMTTSLRLNSLNSAGIKSKILFKIPCYSVDLEKIRTTKKPYLNSISSNTRYQINRSKKQYKQHYGDLSIQTALSVSEAIQFFENAGEKHIERWQDSGFKNDKFIRFHENLIKNNFGNNSIDLIKVSAGDKTIAIMYNLILNNKVYFYLQGLNYENDKKLKPGLVSHSLIIQYYLDKEMNLYDFMGGYSQYKTQLASHSSDCYSICIQKPKIKFALETIGKKLKQVINKQN